MAGQVTHRLCSIDPIIQRPSRCCLCFPCDSEGASVKLDIEALRASVKRIVHDMPWLEGTVSPIEISLAATRRVHDPFATSLDDSFTLRTGETFPPHPKDSSTRIGSFRRRSTESASGVPSATSFHRTISMNNPRELLRSIREVEGDSDTGVESGGHVEEVCFTMGQARDFLPTVKWLGKDEISYTYRELEQKGMPAGPLSGGVLIQLADMADAVPGGKPVFAVQANIIEGGVLVTIFYMNRLLMLWEVSQELCATCRSLETLLPLLIPSHRGRAFASTDWST